MNTAQQGRYGDEYFPWQVPSIEGIRSGDNRVPFHYFIFSLSVMQHVSDLSSDRAEFLSNLKGVLGLGLCILCL